MLNCYNCIYLDAENHFCKRRVHNVPGVCPYAEERKRNGYGDRHKKRQGGRYVRLPSDHLTKKEREAMNGEVISFDPRKFYTAEEFNKLSEEFKVKWLNSIMNRYAVGLGSIGQVVLEKSVNYLYEQAKRQGYVQYLNKPKGKGSPKRADIEKLKKDVAEARGITTAYKEQVSGLIGKLIEKNPDFEIRPEVEKPVEAPKEEKPTVKADANNLAVLLSTLMGTGAKLTIELTL